MGLWNRATEPPSHPTPPHTHGREVNGMSHWDQTLDQLVSSVLNPLYMQLKQEAVAYWVERRAHGTLM